MMIATTLSAFLAILGPVADAPNAGANPAAVASAAPQAPENPKITQRIKDEFAAWQRGQLDRSAYSAATNEQLNEDAVDVMSDHLKPLGAVRSASSLFSYKEAGSTIYVYSVRCEKGSVRMKLGLDAAGKITAVSFEPES